MTTRKPGNLLGSRLLTTLRSPPLQEFQVDMPSYRETMQPPSLTCKL
jgi:hypothetical protein